MVARNKLSVPIGRSRGKPYTRRHQQFTTHGLCITTLDHNFLCCTQLTDLTSNLVEFFSNLVCPDSSSATELKFTSNLMHINLNKKSNCNLQELIPLSVIYQKDQMRLAMLLWLNKSSLAQQNSLQTLWNGFLVIELSQRCWTVIALIARPGTQLSVMFRRDLCKFSGRCMVRVMRSLGEGCIRFTHTTSAHHSAHSSVCNPNYIQLGYFTFAQHETI